MRKLISIYMKSEDTYIDKILSFENLHKISPRCVKTCLWATKAEQSDQDLYSPLTESLDTTNYMDGE